MNPIQNISTTSVSNPASKVDAEQNPATPPLPPPSTPATHQSTTAVALLSLASQPSAVQAAAESAVLKKCVLMMLKDYDERFTNDVFGLMPIKDLANIVKTILILKVAKLKPEAAQKALNQWLMNEGSKEQSDELEWGNFHDFCLECGISTSLLKEYVVDFTICVAAERQDSQAPSTSNSTQSHLVIQNISRLIKEFSQLLEPFWNNITTEMDRVLIGYRQYPQRITAVKNQTKSQGVSHKELVYDFVIHLADSATRLLSQLKLYCHERIPKINFHCSRLDLQSPDFFRQSMIISSVVKRAWARVDEITQKLSKEFSLYESNSSLNFGIPAQTENAKELQSNLYLHPYMAQFTLCKDLILFLGTFSNDKSNEAFICQTISHKALNKWLSFIVETFKDGKFAGVKKDEAKKKEDATLSSKESDFIKSLISCSAAAIKKFRQSLYDFYLDSFKSPRHAEMRTEFEMKKTIEIFERLSKEVRFDLLPKNDVKVLIEALLNLFILIQQEMDRGAKSEDNYNQWLENEAQVAKEAWGKLKGKGVIVLASDIKGEFEHAVQMVKKADALRISISKIASLVNMLDAFRVRSQETTAKDNGLKADACLHNLQLEEEAAAAKKAYEDAEQAQKKKSAADEKQKKEASAKSSTPPPETVTFTPTTKQAIRPAPTRATSRFNTPTVHLLFELRNGLAQYYGIDPAQICLPISMSGTQPTPSEIAVRQQLYANDCLMTALEIRSKCTDFNDLALVNQLVLQWGYSALEQGLSTEYAKAFPMNSLQHDLAMLLHSLGVSLNNIWTEHAASHTLYQRYPWYFTASGNSALPIALQIIREKDGAAAKKFGDDLPKWVEEAASLQVKVAAHKCTNKQNIQIKTIEAVVEKLRKIGSLKSKESSEVDQKEALSKKNESVLNVCVKKLNKALQLFQGNIKARNDLSDDALKALKNAAHHLLNLRNGLGLFKRFPQQRFMHLHLQALHASIKNFSENLGVVLSYQQGDGWYTHSLQTYHEHYGLAQKFSSEILQTLAMIDVEKGDEYPFKYFAHHSAKNVSKLMHVLNEFYARSQEAILIGEGAVPAGLKSKDVSALQAELTDWAQRFTELASTLATTHLSTG